MTVPYGIIDSVLEDLQNHVKIEVGPLYKDAIFEVGLAVADKGPKLVHNARFSDMVCREAVRRGPNLLRDLLDQLEVFQEGVERLGNRIAYIARFGHLLDSFGVIMAHKAQEFANFSKIKLVFRFSGGLIRSRCGLITLLSFEATG